MITNNINRILVFLAILILSTMAVQAATLTCQQISSASLSVPQFSSKTIEIKCTASGGTVSGLLITPNSNPSTGLTIASTQTMSSSISSGSSTTGKWSVTGDSPNTYSVSYTVSSDGTSSWTGASTTAVTVPSAAQLTVDYVLPPSIFTPTVETLDFKINNIGGTTANNVNMKLYLGSTQVGTATYPTTIAAGATASYSWTNSTGFNESGTYTTEVYIGEVFHDNVTTAVNTPSSNLSQNTGWNLISLTKIPVNNSPVAVFADVVGNIERVWGMTSTGWKRYTPGGTDYIQEMSVEYAYWIKTTDDITTIYKA